MSRPSFEELFGRAPEAAAAAPGRVNLIGDHTDYNGGYVLPTPIPRRARIELAARAGDEVRAVSVNLGDGRSIESWRAGAEQPRGAWTDYLMGVAQVLRRDGYEIGALDIRLDSELPIGGGLSSSAALAVAFQRALRERFGLPLDDLQLARVVQRAENEFVGARVGVMDPLVSSLGVEGAALFVDTLDLTRRLVPIPAGAELVVIHSGTGHRHAAGGYNERRQECERAAARLGVRRLRDLADRDLDRVAALPPPLDRRVRHVLGENRRVLAAVQALERGQLERLGELLDESHRSLREDFEVSTTEIERLVAALRAASGVHGARLTGGGFGGSVMALAARGRGRAAAEQAAAACRDSSGREAQILLPAGIPAAGRGPGGAAGVG